MGNNLSIGIGQGNATVWNPSPAIQQFGNILAQQKAEKAAKDQALINQMSSLKSDGIRDADKEDYLNKYNDWKQSAIAASNMPKNSRDRLDAIANAQSKYNSLGDFISSSKEEKGHENSLGNMWIGNQHLFSDDAHQKFIKSMQSPMSSSDFIGHDKYGTFERYIDPVKLHKNLDGLVDKGLKSTQFENPVFQKYVRGNEVGTVGSSHREYAPEDILSDYMHNYDMNDELKAYTDKHYQNISGANPAETKALRLKQLALDRGDLLQNKDGSLKSNITEDKAIPFKANDDSFAKHIRNRQYDIDHPLPSTIAANQQTPSQTLISGMQTGIPGSGEKLLSLAPHGQYGKNKPDIKFDPNTGEHVFNFPEQVDKDGLPKAPKKTYKLNPVDPDTYYAQAAQMAKEQNINLSQLNQIEGIKGGHGQIPQIKKNNGQSSIKLAKGSLNNL